MTYPVRFKKGDTKMLSKVYLLALIASVVNCESNLELVQVFFRHGARTPEKKDTYPTDPYGADDFKPMGWGQLTNFGKSQGYQLGKLLRKRYGTFLGDLYTSDVATVTTTDYERTKMTALLVLAGLFPPSVSQQWDENLLWNPIPYEYEKAVHDYFLRRPTNYCPNYVKELKEIEKSPITARIIKENRMNLDYIAKHTGLEMNDLMSVFKLYQTLNAEENMNMTLPEWTNKVYPGVIPSLAGIQCQLENYNVILKKLNGGRSLQKIIKNIWNKVRNIMPNHKIQLHSGHENNVINILAALNLYEPHVSKYSAAVILELHFLQEVEEYAIKILYAREPTAEPEELTLDGCSVLCPFDKFLTITKPYVPVNYTEECGSTINLD